MYVNYYKLQSEPFGITPDPRFLFLSAAHREALAALVYGVSQRKGFISIIGEVGTGKTIVLRAFLEGIDQARTTAISLLNPLATFDQILDEILPVDFVGSSQDKFRSLQEWLIEEYRRDRNVVVAIDEAQCMAPATLERLRLLSNLETADHKLIQIVLAGQPELELKLAQADLRQLRERIAVQARIGPLNHADSIAYVKHRLAKVCDQNDEAIFSPLAMNYLARRGGGNPRRLNILFDAALLAGFSYQQRPITFPVAWESSSRSTARVSRHRTALVRGLSVALVALIAASVARYWPADVQEVAVATPPSTEVQRVSAQPTAEQVTETSSTLNQQLMSQAQSRMTLALLPLSDIANDSPAVEYGSHPEQVVDETQMPAAALGAVDFGSTREVVVVNRGDGLWQLCREIYGNADVETVRYVLHANPHIADPNALTVGEEIHFPPLVTASKTSVTRASNNYLED